MNTINEVRDVVLDLAETWGTGSEQIGLWNLAHNDEALAQLTEDLGEIPATRLSVSRFVFQA